MRLHGRACGPSGWQLHRSAGTAADRGNHPGAPECHERAFVLAPWLDIDPEAQLPGRGPVRELLAGVDADGIRRRPGMVLLPPQAGPAAEVR